MKYLSIVFAFMAVLLFSLEEIAEAKRFGGGKSFGGRSSFSSSAPKAPSSGTFNNQSNSFRQNNNANAAAGTATANRSGFGMGGLFGGLLAGTFIGSMLSGTPGGGGGMMDLLIIGLLVYFGIRIFRGFAQKGSNNARQEQYSQRQSNNNQSNIWDNLQNNSQDYNNSTTSYAQEERNELGIDRAEFIEGAKSAFIRMQESWDKRDLEDIKHFTSESVYNEIKEQAQESPEQSNTQILSLSADIHKIEKEDESQRVSVYFTAFIREEKEQAMAQNVTELWHFLRENSNAHWKIDGIQQIS